MTGESSYMEKEDALYNSDSGLKLCHLNLMMHSVVATGDEKEKVGLTLHVLVAHLEGKEPENL
jgi:hypothetical protein